MKKIIFILASSFTIINSMEQGGNKPPCSILECELAILNEDEKEIKSLLKDPIDQSNFLFLWKDDELNNCLDFAITNNKKKATQLLARKISRKIEKLEMVITIPFRLAGEKNNISYLNELMQLDISTSLKNKGCDQALKAACMKEHFPIINQLINSYGKYIEHPIYNYSFERLAIVFPQKHSNIIETILSHPKAAENLEEMINTNWLSYPNEKQRYFELLKKAKEIQKNKKS